METKPLVVTNDLIYNYFTWLPSKPVYAILCVTLLFALLKPRIGLYFFIGSMFYRLQDRIESLETFPIFALQLLCLLIGLAMSKEPKSPMNEADKMLMKFFLFSSLGLLIKDHTALISFTYAYLCSIAVYYLVRRLIYTQEHYKQMMFFAALFIGFLNIEALYAFYNQDTTNFFFVDDGRLQSVGFYKNANELAFVSNLSLAFLLTLFLLNKSMISRMIYITLMIININVIALTLSRSGLLSIALIIAVLLILRSKGNLIKKGVTTMVFFVVLLGVLSLVPGPVKDRLATMQGDSEDASMEGRYHSWEEGFRMVGWNPIFGVGRQQWIEHHPLAAHNAFVQTVAETGLIGLFLFLSFLKKMLNQFSPIINVKGELTEFEHTELKVLAIGLVSVFGLLLWYFMFGNITYHTITYFIFGLVSSITVLIAEKSKVMETEDKPNVILNKTYHKN